MDIEKAKEQLLKHKKEIDAKYISARYSKAIETVLSELDKKDKIIDEILLEFYKKAHISTKCYLQDSIEKCMKHKNCIVCLREYFTNKAISEKPTEGEYIRLLKCELDKKDKIINFILEDIRRRSIDGVISTEELLQEYKEKFEKAEGN